MAPLLRPSLHRQRNAGHRTAAQAREEPLGVPVPHELEAIVSGVKPGTVVRLGARGGQQRRMMAT